MNTGYEILKSYKNDGSLSAKYKKDISDFVFAGVCSIRFGSMPDSIYDNQLKDVWSISKDDRSDDFTFSAFNTLLSIGMFPFKNDRNIDVRLRKSGFLLTDEGKTDTSEFCMFNMYALRSSTFGKDLNSSYGDSLLSYAGLEGGMDFYAGNTKASKAGNNGLLNADIFSKNYYDIPVGNTAQPFEMNTEAMVFILQSQLYGYFLGEYSDTDGYLWEKNIENAGVFVATPLVNLVSAPSGSGVSSHLGCLAQVLSDPGGKMTDYERGTKKINIGSIYSTVALYDKPFFHIAFSGAALKFRNNQLNYGAIKGGNLSFQHAIIGDVSINNFTHSLLASTNFSNFNISGRNFAFATMKGGFEVGVADFTKATSISTLKNDTILFNGCRLDEAKFNKGQLKQEAVDLGGAFLNFDLIGRNWASKNLKGVTFVGGLPDPLSSKAATLDANGANLDDNDFTGVSFDYATIEENATFNGTILTNASFDHAQLVQAIFDGAKDLSGVKFTNVRMWGASFVGTDLSKTIFKAAYMNRVVFKEAVLTGLTFNKDAALSMDHAIFDDVKHMKGVTFSNVDLTGASFKNADLTGVTFEKVTLTGADFTGATLSGVDLSGLDLRGIHFNGATMHKTKLQNAKLQGAIFDGADMTGARLDHAHLQQNEETNKKTSLRGTDLTGAILFGADCTHADFSAMPAKQGGQSEKPIPANLTGAFMQNCTLDNANLDGVIMENAKFFSHAATGTTGVASAKDASFNNATLYKAFLLGADFQGAQMNGVHMIQATLIDANMQKAQLQPPSQDTQNSSNLTSAKLQGANFTGADMDGVDMSGATASKKTGHYRGIVEPPKGSSGVRPVIIAGEYSETILGITTGSTLPPTWDDNSGETISIRE